MTDQQNDFQARPGCLEFMGVILKAVVAGLMAFLAVVLITGQPHNTPSTPSPSSSSASITPERSGQMEIQP